MRTPIAIGIPSFTWPVCDLTTKSGQYLSNNSTYKTVTDCCHRTTARQIHRSHISAGFRTVSAGLKISFLSLFFPSVITDEMFYCVQFHSQQPMKLPKLSKKTPKWSNTALVFSESVPSLQASHKHATVHGSKIWWGSARTLV